MRRSPTDGSMAVRKPMRYSFEDCCPLEVNARPIHLHGAVMLCDGPVQILHAMRDRGDLIGVKGCPDTSKARTSTIRTPTQTNRLAPTCHRLILVFRRPFRTKRDHPPTDLQAFFFFSELFFHEVKSCDCGYRRACRGQRGDCIWPCLLCLKGAHHLM